MNAPDVDMPAAGDRAAPPGRGMGAVVGIGIDWGSSNVRAWVFGDDGAVRAANALEIGLSEAAREGFGVCYDRLLAPLNAPPGSPAVACGMIGARNGWFEVPYIDCPGDLDARLARPVPTPRAGLYILPGAAMGPPGPDVMRGEETQIRGAVSVGHRGRFCLPGTHSKWASVDGGRMTGFETHVTGELFALARERAIFGQLTEDGAFDRRAFALGVDAAQARPLSALLFQPRSRVLAGMLSPRESTWFLSGALIGREILSANPDRVPVVLIADGLLGTLYGEAMTLLHRDHVPLSAETCTTAALFRSLEILHEETR